MPKQDYLTHVLDLLFPFGGITFCAMFGGYGIYKEGVIFAIIADNVLYFKVDDVNRADYEAKDSKPFTFERKGLKNPQSPSTEPVVIRQHNMSYWQVPEEILENKEDLTIWVKKAYEAGIRAKELKEKMAN